jgi:hypothetical protein
MRLHATKAPRVIFLESLEGVESLFTRGLRTGAAAAGWRTDVIFLSDDKGQPRSEKDVRIDLLNGLPDVVCFLMDAPLALRNIWDAPSLGAVEKIALWYDDFYRSPRTLAQPAVWTEWQKNHGVRVGIWDGYWRCQWKMLTGHDAFATHLAADPRLLRPVGEPFAKEWSERAVLTGTVPSLKSLEDFAAAFPAHMGHFLDDIRDAMATAPWPLRPYEIALKCRSYLAFRYTRAIDATLKDPTTLALWQCLLWRWAKRIARLRGLNAVAQAGPIGVLSGHGTERYAGEDEIRAALPKGADFVYADTKDVPASSWQSLFRTGKFQLQITDPQSIEGGLPFRVFECGACGVPLLSDFRPELGLLFPPDTGLVTATDEASLRREATRLFEMPRREIEQKGHALHLEVSARHTWEARWRELVAGRELRSQTTPYTHPAAVPPPPPSNPLIPQTA